VQQRQLAGQQATAKGGARQGLQLNAHAPSAGAQRGQQSMRRRGGAARLQRAVSRLAGKAAEAGKAQRVARNQLKLWVW
jgi:hypothetical protein